MSELFNFTLADMLLFSADTYVRLFELYNTDIWPLQAVAVVFSGVLAAAVWPGRKLTPYIARLCYLSLAISWLWIAYAFHLQRYDAINLAGKTFAVMFAVQGLLLLATAIANAPEKLFANSGASANIGRFFVVLGIIIWPLASVAATGNWRSMQLVALTPDPTAIATLGLVILALGRGKYLLSVVPLTWVAISAATHWALFTA